MQIWAPAQHVPQGLIKRGGPSLNIKGHTFSM